jgi:hypothetical protein
MESISVAKPRMLAFQMRQNVTGTEPLNTFLTRVLDIQMETGIDFFSDLDDGLEMKLEGEKAKGLW